MICYFLFKSFTRITLSQFLTLKSILLLFIFIELMFLSKFIEMTSCGTKLGPKKVNQEALIWTTLGLDLSPVRFPVILKDDYVEYGH